MDREMYNVIYIDERATEDRTWPGTIPSTVNTPLAVRPSLAIDPTAQPPAVHEIEQTVKALLAIFPNVHVCRTSSECLARIARAENAELGLTCTFVIIHMPREELHPVASKASLRSPSPTSRKMSFADSFHSMQSSTDDLTGMDLLMHITAEKRAGKISNRTLSVALLDSSKPDLSPVSASSNNSHMSNDLSPTSIAPRKRLGRGVSWGKEIISLQYHEAGAVDVMQSPITIERARGLPSHAYRTLCDVKLATPRANRAKKGSWMGVQQQQARSQPFAYLREEMVSDLMDRICDPEREEYPISINELKLDPRRREAIENTIGTWNFSAHEFNDDELVYGASLMLQHALSLPEVEQWHMSAESITVFLIACRRVYNSFVLYHNFRHACDVLQATFFLLISIGALPPFSLPTSATSATSNSHTADTPSPTTKEPHTMAKLLSPFHCLTLLISAIGHDVGHPGVNNLFLVTLNAPLAQLYNDRSVLESFHCAAYSQILRRHWPGAFKNTAMRKMMINSILATDMGVHGQYMSQASQCFEKFKENGYSISGIPEEKLEEYRELICCLIIKCADICNVCRTYDTATKWAFKLTDEFSNQASMEQELRMPTCLFGGPPVRDDMIKMGVGQIGFINFFVVPLFEAANKILPGMEFAINEAKANCGIWQDVVDEAKATKAALTRTQTPPSNTTIRPTASLQPGSNAEQNSQSIEATSKAGVIQQKDSSAGVGGEASTSKNSAHSLPRKPNSTMTGSTDSNTASSITKSSGQHRPSTGPTLGTEYSHDSLRRTSSCGSLISTSRRHSMTEQLRDLDGSSDEHPPFSEKNGISSRIRPDQKLKNKISLQGFRSMSTRRNHMNGNADKHLPTRRSDLALRLREKLTLNFWKQRKMDKGVQSD